MKIGWGTKIALLYIAFVVFMVSIVVFAMKQKFELVTPDYYARELDFQKKIDATKRAEDLKEKLKILATEDHIVLQFPQKMSINKNITGKIQFFRPSDAAMDIVIPVNIDSTGRQILNNKNFYRGFYNVNISWKFDNKDYFTANDIFVR